MADPTLTEALKEAMVSVPADVADIYTFEVEHADLAAPLRFVDNNEPGVFTLEDLSTETFTEVIANWSRPKKETNVSAESRIMTDNTAGLFDEIIQVMIDSDVMPTIKIRTYLSTDYTTPQRADAILGRITSIDKKLTEITISISHSNLNTKRSPTIFYTTDKFP